MLTWLLFGVVVMQAAIITPSTMLILQIGIPKYAGSRDEVPAPSKYRARAMRAAANTVENMPMFFVLGVLALIAGTVDMEFAILGAQIFVSMRIAYLFSYIFAVPYVRSTLWTIGWVGLAMMFFALL